MDSSKEQIYTIAAINPGGTSTKIGLFKNREEIFRTVVEHSAEELKKYSCIFDQYPYRYELIRKALEKTGISLGEIAAVVGRGGLMQPIPGGTYRVTPLMLEDLRERPQGLHASNLGAALAKELGDAAGAPSFIVDPVSTDEMEPVGRISGFAEMERPSRCHALNHKAVARRVAKEMGGSYEDYNFVVAHLGTGTSVAAHARGRMIDVCDAVSEGPFSPERAGGLPAATLVQLCYSGKYSFDELYRTLYTKSGIYSYLGTKDLREVEKMAREGNETAALLLEALPYQVAKEIAAQASVLSGKVDRIILTGGMAHSKNLVEGIKARVGFIAPLEVVPGEEELASLAEGALRILRGEEKPRIYPSGEEE
jgi:butyrate kinase